MAAFGAADVEHFAYLAECSRAEAVPLPFGKSPSFQPSLRVLPERSSQLSIHSSIVRRRRP
ncbi:hypothetical protein HETIRDRAFT_448898 [Heterobasidion irregulare TC 32-1]|uniref:Uncharacterized protein n=1 Tax=Heterobasidion irregulare (strain TC 32-1) TaxID=747525 RepID=W4KJS5_HETIT|nr:uncharacterized protein HETIRDRAFT_448898 [Heterobasidion irregulare TC 32-1]ETW85954.1 hypothetical protein HETIRDRAFT_448898 [Heterobasidion irregulare TC 32-1]